MNAPLRAHPAADVFPMMSDAEIATLAEDIKKNGQHMPITTVLEEGEVLILDGRNRARACAIAGTRPLTQAFAKDADPFAFVVGANLHRRHLNTSQRAMIAAEIARLKNGTNRHTLAVAQATASQSEAAALLGVSRDSVMRARKVKEHAVPEVQAAVVSGQLEVKTAARLASMPPEEQRSRMAIGDMPKDKPSAPPESEPRRIFEHDGKAAKEIRGGIVLVAAGGDGTPDPDTARTSRDNGDKIRKLASQGFSAREIASKMGLGNSAVYSALRQRKNPLEGALLDVQTFTDVWNAKAAEEYPRWMLAIRSERDELASALEECVRAARRMINRLKKEAEKEKKAS